MPERKAPLLAQRTREKWGTRRRNKRDASRGSLRSSSGKKRPPQDDNAEGSGLAAAHALVHGLVGEAVGFLIVLAESMSDREPVELGDQFFGAAMEIF
jgi:hypothetical protein